MSTTSNTASDGGKTSVRKGAGGWIAIAVIALLGLALCAVIGSTHVTDDPSQASLIGP